MSYWLCFRFKVKERDRETESERQRERETEKDREREFYFVNIKKHRLGFPQVVKVNQSIKSSEK